MGKFILSTDAEFNLKLAHTISPSPFISKFSMHAGTHTVSVGANETSALFDFSVTCPCKQVSKQAPVTTFPLP
jgi:hypothetical protein